MFGKVIESPQTEKTPFYPRSLMESQRFFLHWMTINYRESYKMFAAMEFLTMKAQEEEKHLLQEKLLRFRRLN